NSVIVTGTFDEWSSSIHLVKNESGFHGSIKIPWDTTIYYKYVVDSNWVCEITSPTQTDNAGNVNNVYTSPPKPVEAVGAP
ncbi:carbohydrate-binding module family 48 protein, partial [Mycena capillaripes]